jgi:hypothetical protein
MMARKRAIYREPENRGRTGWANSHRTVCAAPSKQAIRFFFYTTPMADHHLAAVTITSTSAILMHTIKR